MNVDFLTMGDYFVLVIGPLIAPVLSILWFLRTR